MSISNYVAKKANKDPKEIHKIFKGVNSFEGLIEAMNETLNVPELKMNKDPGYEKSGIQEKERLSYKVKFLKDLGIEIPKDGTYLDHGCGSGKITSEVNREFGPYDRVIGVDIYEHDLLKGRGIDFVRPGDDGTLNIPSDSVSFITCFLSIHHVSLQKKTAQELMRILKPGGLLVILEHNFKKSMRLFLDAVHMTFSLYGTENENERSDSDNDENQNPNMSKKIVPEDVQWIKDTKYLTLDQLRKLFSGLQDCKYHNLRNSQEMYFIVFTKGA